jgi:Spy/CpxP family protein refolding chaperone
LWRRGEFSTKTQRHQEKNESVAAQVSLQAGHTIIREHAGEFGRWMLAFLFLAWAASSARSQTPSAYADYPVPAHILQWSDTLRLTEEQIKQIEAISDAMNAQAQTLGIDIIALEEQLQELLRAGTASARVTDSLAAELAGLRGEMRSLSRSAYLQANRMLTSGQQAVYAALRGRTGPAQDSPPPAGGKR